MNHKSLGSIAHTFGLTMFRPLDKDERGEDIYILQAKDVVIGEAMGSLEHIMKAPFNGRVSNSLKSGDIVLVTRCTEEGFFRAALFTAKNKVPVTTGTSLIALRVHSDAIMPEYLVSYLNSVSGQVALHKLARGSTIKFLPQAQLKEALIPILSKNQQKSLVELEKNIRQQIRLLEESKNIFHKLLNGVSQSLFSPNV